MVELGEYEDIDSLLISYFFVFSLIFLIGVVRGL